MAKFMTFETCPYCDHLIEIDPETDERDFSIECENCNTIVEHDRRESYNDPLCEFEDEEQK